MLCVQVGGEGRGGVVLIFYEFGLAKLKAILKMVESNVNLMYVKPKILV